MICVITGSSYSGKSTLQEKLLTEYEFPIHVFKTCTTRRKRPYEEQLPTEKLPYHFLTHEEFLSDISEDKFFEFKKLNKGDHDDYYGSRKEDIQKALESEELFVAVLEPRGANDFQTAYPDVIVVYLEAPSLEILKERALARGTETSEDLFARLERAKDLEIPLREKFTNQIVNNSVEETFEAIKTIIKKERSVENE